MYSQELQYSVVVPLYNEELVIHETYKRLKSVMDSTGESYEIIFVNDGSRDKTLEIARSLCREDKSIKLLGFSRNFGHQVAITAGMDYAGGKAVIVIDADLQDPPEVILKMIEKWKEGYEVVYGRRIKRMGETFLKKATAAVFYRVLKSMTSVDIPVDTGDFRLIDRKVCDALKSIPERNRYVRGLISWLGFKQTGVEFVREERFAGETKYPLKKMVKFAADAITSFSYKPLKIATYAGTVLSLSSFAYLLFLLEKLFTRRPVAGWAPAVTLCLLCNGLLFILLGIIGEYVGRIYDEAKGRPLYIIDEKEGF
ncbi:MAG: glycosyltransferase family 2 protein [Clostridiales bacterium]|nr:glycosyltransferase family 2 protein [Eubacteriales bacterium]MDH7567712.1 glycosyltransferase family 2 protein [Clostridiales bacterium]